MAGTLTDAQMAAALSEQCIVVLVPGAATTLGLWTANNQHIMFGAG